MKMESLFMPQKLAGINWDKFKNAVLFIAKNGGWNVGKKKLAKLLYFVDFTLYELKEKSLTGIDYVKQSYGPMPNPLVFYDALRELETGKVIQINEKDAYGLEKIVPIDDYNLSVFNEEERKILEQLTEKHKLDNASDLERVAQSEPPYKMVTFGDSIPYHLAFYRNTFGEMDIGDENTNS